MLTRGDRTAARGSGALVGIDSDPLDVLARLFGLRQADGQYAIAEVGFGLVLLDAIERNAALERSVVALAVFAALVVFASNAKLIDAMNHEAVILTQQDARMAFSAPVWGASLTGEVHQVRQI